MKCEEYWPETCEMQFGNIKATPISIEDRPDRVVRKLTVSQVWDCDCSSHYLDVFATLL